MKKFILTTLLLIIILLVLVNSVEIISSITFSFNLCINKLFPTLIPFMIISNILINYNYIYDLSNMLNPIMSKFKVNKNCSFAFIMSIFSGTPSNAKYLKDLLDNNLITENDCIKCLKFCHFTNPIFIIGTIGYTYFHNKKLGLIILISQYLSSILIGLFSKKENTIIYNNIKRNNSNKSFFKIFNESIISTFNALLLVLGIISTCLIITCILNKYININSNYKFIFGLIEITQGLNYLFNSNLSIILKLSITSFLISFGGISIHMQVFSILENKKIRYKPYLISRIIHGILSVIIVLLLSSFIRITYIYTKIFTFT